MWLCCATTSLRTATQVLCFRKDYSCYEGLIDFHGTVLDLDDTFELPRFKIGSKFSFWAVTSFLAMCSESCMLLKVCIHVLKQRRVIHVHAQMYGKVYW